MTISSEINILSNAISNLKTAIRNKGQTVPSNATVASLKNKIENISNESGGEYSKSPLTDIIEGTIEVLYDTILDYVRPYCFSGCNVFREAYFSNLKKICPHAFDKCYNFKTLILDSTFVYLENTNAFRYTLIEKGQGKIYVRDDLISTYINDENWSKFSSYIDLLSNY